MKIPIGAPSTVSYTCVILVGREGDITNGLGQ